MCAVDAVASVCQIEQQQQFRNCGQTIKLFPGETFSLLKQSVEFNIFSFEKKVTTSQEQSLLKVSKVTLFPLIKLK